MGQHHDGDSPASYRSVQEVVFLGLRDAVFCTQCELISPNHSTRCLACGSLALLNLSRVLGGSLRNQETARLVRDEEIHSAVGEVMRWTDPFVAPPSGGVPVVVLEEAGRPQWEQANCRRSIPLPALETGVRRCCDLTGASGAAVAISNGRTIVCRARAGSTAPDIGTEVPQRGLTALSIRSRRLWHCNDTEGEAWANQDACRAIGIRSILIAPIVIPNQVLGVLEVFSPLPSAFDDYHSAAVQLIASALAVVMVGGSLSTVPARNESFCRPMIPASIRAPR